MKVAYFLGTTSVAHGWPVVYLGGFATLCFPFVQVTLLIPCGHSSLSEPFSMVDSAF